MPEISNIAVVGAGTMGNGIAHVFALAGYPVCLVDVDDSQLDRARGAIEKNLQRQVAKGICEATQADEALARLRLTTVLEEAAEGAQLIIEAILEEAAPKRAVLSQLDRLASSETVLASNTSSISITRLASFTQRPDRVIGMHFFNPVPVMRLVEIVRGLETSDETFELVFGLAGAIGKTPVAVNDYPGFVSNRVLMPMINEAAFCLMEGVASAESIDEVMRLGMAHPMGPLALADLIGLDVCLSILEVLHAELGDDKYRPCPLLRRLVAAGRLGRKSGKGFHDY